jgi:Spx/MgsR family transcriptional regulator
MSMTLYGIPNCDSVRKARGWLDGLGLDYTFHDYKKSGIKPDKLREWIDARGWEAILNRQGPTFRKLDEGDKSGLDADKAVEVMCAHTSTIKRPVLEYDNDDDTGLLVGFDEQEWSTALGGELT